MAFNEGRNIYLHEILVDYLKNTEEYSDENIQKKLVQLYKLKKKENLKPPVLSREERIELNKLKTFFSKNFQLSFSDSRLIYPRFKEAYAKAKSAIINLRSAYDNVINEYYKLISSSYYEYKDPKYLAYLNYIKKKIIVAKADAGIFDYNGKDFYKKEVIDSPDEETPDEGDDTDSENDNTTKPFDISLLENTPPASTPAINGTSANGKAANGEAAANSKAANGNTVKVASDATGPAAAASATDKDATAAATTTVKTAPAPAAASTTTVKAPVPAGLPVKQPLYSVGDANQYNLKYMLMMTPPPIAMMGGDNDNFKMPTTLQEKYTTEGKYIDKLLNDFDDIDEFLKNISEIKKYISDELYNFIYGTKDSSILSIDNRITSIKNTLKETLNYDNDDDDTHNAHDGTSLELQLSEISSIKNELLKYENSKQIENILGKQSNFIENKKKYLDFLQKKIPEIYNKDNDIYVKNFPDIKNIINGSNTNDVNNKKLLVLINDFHKYSIDIYNILKDNLKQYRNSIIELENIVKNKISNKEKIEIEKARTTAYYNRAKSSYSSDMRRGGASGNIDTLKKDYDDIYNILTTNTKNLKIIFIDIQKQIKSKYEDPYKKISLNNNGEFQDNVRGISIFDKIWKNYVNDIKDDKKLIENTEDKLYQTIKTNDLDPIIALELTLNDKLLFIVITYFIRQLSLNMVEYFIDNGTIKDIISALIFYVICYTIIIILMTVFINLDSYKLRIIFNYFNLHINKYNLIMHIFIIAVFTFLIYSLILNINFPIQNINQKYISESDKIKLIYRLDILTIIIYIFTSLFIILM
jgi:hypothetical protein